MQQTGLQHAYNLTKLLSLSWHNKKNKQQKRTHKDAPKSKFHNRL